jgi:hypothetical protein
MSKAVVFSILFQLCAILTNSQIDCFYHCSLKRLGTDYIDIYQLHWPDRYVPMFGDVDYNPSSSYKSVPIEEQLQVLAAAIDAGKVALLFAPYLLFCSITGCQVYNHIVMVSFYTVLMFSICLYTELYCFMSILEFTILSLIIMLLIVFKPWCCRSGMWV